MITDIEDYFTKGCGRCARFATSECSTRQWSLGLQELRRICREAGLVETVKWGHPCYMQAGRNIAIIVALRSDFRLSFMNAALMTDARSMLEKSGPNTAHPDMIRFTSNAQVAAMEPVIRAYLEEAIGYALAGIKPPKAAHDLDLPTELVDAMDSDPELAEAFHTLTPGRQRSYVINLNSAKTAATRLSRIAKFRGRILAGKGATER
jgi:uncharacterized protein YdeI (YjbR/CyaY-like superfamily)